MLLNGFFFFSEPPLLLFSQAQYKLQHDFSQILRIGGVEFVYTKTTFSFRRLLLTINANLDISSSVWPALFVLTKINLSLLSLNEYSKAHYAEPILATLYVGIFSSSPQAKLHCVSSDIDRAEYKNELYPISY